MKPLCHSERSEESRVASVLTGSFTSFRMTACLVFVLMVVSCGGSTTDAGEDYGNLYDTPDSIFLTQAEHEIGWGKSECTMCHNLENIHLENRTGDAGVDIDDTRQQALDGGESSCTTCHGANGVP